MAQQHITPEQYRALVRKPHKWHAKPCVVDGLKFPSQRQAQRYRELRLLVLAGAISDLEIDGKLTTFRLEVNGQLICQYRADAIYRERGELVVEDSKGFRTDVYRLKRKLMQACHGIEIREV